MNRYIMIILTVAAVAAAEDQDLGKRTSALAEANRAHDVAKITKLAKSVTASGDARASGQGDLMAAELAKSMAICKRNYDALEAVIEALGKLRSPKGVPALKRVAFRKKVKSDREEAIQADALIALGAMADPKQLGGIEDQTKSRSDVIAKGAYTSLRSYGQAKGRTRRRVAEVLMKRLRAEYPRYSPSSGKRVSPEKRQRWRSISSSIIGSLQAVCRRPTIVSVTGWEEWWKENKKSAKAWRDPKK